VTLYRATLVGGLRRKTMTAHRTSTREEWQAARDELLRLEKEHTRMGDDLSRMRRELPWVRIEKEYRFDTGDGSRTLRGTGCSSGSGGTTSTTAE
jgi:predicted dithiol-disulfide oxidoreductase (DUF899 family)